MVLVLRHPDALFFHLEPPVSALRWCGDVAAAWAVVAWLGWPLLSLNYFDQEHKQLQKLAASVLVEETMTERAAMALHDGDDGHNDERASITGAL